MFLIKHLSSGIWLLLFMTIIDGTPRRFVIDSSCVPPRGDVCIEIRKCPYFAQLLDSSPIPRPRSVIQIIREHQCGFLENTPKICCSVTPTVDEIMEETNKNASITKKDTKIELLPRSTCGMISHDFRITSGSKTSLFEFPWMALIAYQTSEGLDFRCSGTLLNERYVLTAAHCLQNLTFVGVRLGEHNINTKKDCDYMKGYCAPPVQDFYIEDIILHPDYNPRTFDNDIALIRLATSANLTYINVKPICLPSDDNTLLDGKFAVVAGWGITEFGHKSAQLLKTSIPVIPNSDCRKTYFNHAEISENQICAGGYLGRDSCGGDSGGPLKYISKIDGVSKYVQYGIVSYGSKHCGADGQPGVYTRVSKYVKWILDNFKPF